VTKFYRQSQKVQQQPNKTVNMSTQEKTAIQAQEVHDFSASDDVDYAEAQGWDEHATKRLLRRLDWHIIPFMSLIYL
jgi:hypothetical protein